jgi:hypothetical protein
MAKKAPNVAMQARIEVEKWRQYFKFNIDQYHQMHNFVLGRQWTDDEEDMLKSFKKVPLQFNKLGTLVNTLLGEQQQNTPMLEVYPLSNCDEETAQIRETLVKDITLSHDAQKAYQVAAKQAFVGGFGAYLVDTDYVSDKSFDLDIVFRYFKDSTRCYWDVGATDESKIDGMYCGYISRMTREKFKSIYGEKIESKILTQSGVTQTKEEIALATEPSLKDDSFSWADDEGITLINRFRRVYSRDTLYKLSNGRIVNQEEMDELIETSAQHHSEIMLQQMMANSIPGVGMENEYAIPEGEMPSLNITEIEEIESGNKAEDLAEEEDVLTLYDEGMPVRIEDKRPTKKCKIIQEVIAGEYVLEESEFPSYDLPMPFVDQNSYYEKDGKQVCRPFTIDAVDAQRYLNYLGTQSAFILKISRYDQFIGPKGNVRSLDTQRTWRDPNTAQGLLVYDEVDSGAKPEQIRPPELSTSLMQQYQRAVEDMYTSTGLYPTRLGMQGNEVSGAAIDSRTRQGSYSTYVAFNSINSAITAGGKIVNQMIPRVYDTERVISLMTPDKGRQNLVVNEQTDEFGHIKNDLSKGTYEVKLLAGPSYQGQKAQALESLNMVLRANPQLLNLIADLYAENLPLSNTVEIRNRLKTIVPPEILEAGKTGQMPQQAQTPNPQDQAIIAETQFKAKQIELKQAELQLRMQEQQAKTEQVQMELEMKRLELAAELEEQKLRYLAESDRTRSDNAISHADNLTKLLTHKMS